MCGIFGAVALDGTLSYAQSNFLKAATITGQLRGEDGTGWITQAPNSDIRVFKRALCGNDFLLSLQGQQAAGLAIRSRLVIGHNRKTTSGRDVDMDCHPYEYDNVVGVHNGGIPYGALNRLDGTKNTIADVDSAKLYAALNEVEDPIDVLKKIHLGSYALAWVDKRTDELLIARNKDRPMWASSGDEGLYFASEPGMLFWLMSRYGLDAKDSSIYEIQPEHLYRVSLDDPTSVRRTAYEAKAPAHTKSHTTRHYPSGGRAAGSGTDVWYNGAKNTPVNQYCTDPAELSKRFPTLGFFADIVSENLDYVKTAFVDSKDQEDVGRKLDVIVTNVKPSTGGSTFPVLEGYVQDSTNSGIVIPVTFSAQKNDDFNFFGRYNKAMKDDEFFTVRGRINSIRTDAEGTAVILMKLLQVWDTQHNVIRDLDAVSAAEQVEEALKYNVKLSRMTSATLKAKWKALEKPATKH